MSSYCLKCRKNNENINPIVSSTSNGKKMISKYAVCGAENQEAKEILSSLGLKAPLSKVPLLSGILFWMQL